MLNETATTRAVRRLRPHRTRWKRAVNFWRITLILAVLVAVLAVGTSLFVRSLYTYAPNHFEPKDVQRGHHLDGRDGAASP